ncbi:hypothetical protein IE81DRAFT_364658 [Ceraceosorus guamensis]|uniref:Uncharacterized protein n=1 Tax=Ceraceosorus guamensis TaxID=1522189 RepID=A0A316W7E8_9BASI|nr:hypothetical protein IE81DRAFT_364658 [Ceraceosorus guamensis]PWN44661.1 hypothetical protein IE81DRAFT_364658 [Ceraceosorus guamensis]
MTSHELGKQACRALYRAVLRQCPPAVTYSSHATKNLRRLYKWHFEQIMARGNLIDADLKAAERTMLMLLSSTAPRQAPSSPSDSIDDASSSRTSHAFTSSSARLRNDVAHGAAEEADVVGASERKGRLLSHRLTHSLASLTYHHLSPYVLMQRTTRRGVDGGSQSASARRLRAKDDAGEALPSLKVLPRPRRGPFTPALARKSINPLPGEAVEERMQAMYRAKDRMDELLQMDAGAKSEEYEQARRDYVEKRGLVRAAKHTWNAALEERRKEDAPRRLLGSLVQRAERSSGLWLGGPRWARWKQNEMLW